MKQQQIAARIGNACRWADKPSDAEVREECREYAAMGYSRSDVAAILGYSRAHFTRYVLPRIDPNGEIAWPQRGASVACLHAAEDRRKRA